MPENRPKRDLYSRTIITNAKIRHAQETVSHVNILLSSTHNLIQRLRSMQESESAGIKKQLKENLIIIHQLLKNEQIAISNELQRINVQPNLNRVKRRELQQLKTMSEKLKIYSNELNQSFELARNARALTNNLSDAAFPKAPTTNPSAAISKAPTTNLSDASFPKVPRTNPSAASSSKVPRTNPSDASFPKVPTSNLSDASFPKVPTTNPSAAFPKVPTTNPSAPSFPKVPTAKIVIDKFNLDAIIQTVQAEGWHAASTQIDKYAEKYNVKALDVKQEVINELEKRVNKQLEERFEKTFGQKPIISRRTR